MAWVIVFTVDAAVVGHRNPRMIRNLAGELWYT